MIKKGQLLHQQNNFVMQEFVIITPEQLRTVISETVKNEFARQFTAVTSQTQTNEQQDELLTRKQAAKLLGVSLPTLNEWSKSGVVTGYRINTRVRYKRNELEKSLLQMKTSKSNKAA
jgi:excisionase family DNA binding protein